MKLRLLFICLSLVNTSAIAASAAPKPLVTQVQRLTELLRDSYAVGYPDATMVQIIKPRVGDELALAVFTIKGFGGGNNHTQYFAAFTPDTDEKGKQRFMLIDVMPIGGKGWRAVLKLNAKTTQNPKSRETSIAIDALEVSSDDAPNFPSKNITINLVLKNGRLLEQRTQ